MIRISTKIPRSVGIAASASASVSASVSAAFRVSVPRRMKWPAKLPQNNLSAFSGIRFYSTYTEADITPLSDNEYHRIADEELEKFMDAFEDLIERVEGVDAELSMGVLNLETPQGVYVINKQPPNKQLWLSSPISGPNRYDYVNGKWLSLRDGSDLVDLLKRELEENVGESVAL